MKGGRRSSLLLLLVTVALCYSALSSGSARAEVSTGSEDVLGCVSLASCKFSHVSANVLCVLLGVRAEEARRVCWWTTWTTSP